MPEHITPEEAENRFIEERRDLLNKWYGSENLKNNFGPIKPGRTQDPAFIAKVREAFADEVELEVTFPYFRVMEGEFDFPTMIRHGDILPKSSLLTDKLARISSDLRLGEEYWKLKELFFGPDQNEAKD